MAHYNILFILYDFFYKTHLNVLLNVHSGFDWALGHIEMLWLFTWLYVFSLLLLPRTDLIFIYCFSVPSSLGFIPGFSFLMKLLLLFSP